MIKQVWPNNEIKLNFYRNIEANRNKIFKNIRNQNEKSLNIIKRIKTFVYIDTIYVKDVFNLISEDANHIG